jgi:hypothetical protein
LTICKIAYYTVDANFRVEVNAIRYNLGKALFCIKRGASIAQTMICKQLISLAATPPLGTRVAARFFPAKKKPTPFY